MSKLITAKTHSLGAMLFLLLTSITFAVNAALIRLPQDGILILEPGGAGCSRGATDPVIGIDVKGKQRHAFTMRGTTCTIKEGRVDMGYFPAGTDLDFYHSIHWGGRVHYAYSRNIGTSHETPADREVFSSRSRPVVEKKSATHWILHMDDAASRDDDNNDLSVTVRLKPTSSFSGVADDLQLNDFFCGPESSGAPGPVSFSPTNSNSDRVVYTTAATHNDFSGDLKAYQLKSGALPGKKIWSAATELERQSPDGRVMLTWNRDKGTPAPSGDECTAVTIKGAGKVRGGVALRWKYLSSDQRSDLNEGEGGCDLPKKGRLYVVDPFNHKVQVFDLDGTHKFNIGTGKKGKVAGQFDFPIAVTVDSAGYVYVADKNNFRIQKFDSNGKFIRQWGKFGRLNHGAHTYAWVGTSWRPLKPLTGGEFAAMTGIAVDSSDNIYVSDSENSRVQKFDSDGNFLREIGRRTGWSHVHYRKVPDGRFVQPRGIAIDSKDNIYVVDSDTSRIQKFDSAGNFILKWGDKGGCPVWPKGTCDGGAHLERWSYGRSLKGLFQLPRDIAIDSKDNVYISDSNNHRVQKFDSSGNYLLQWGGLHVIRWSTPGPTYGMNFPVGLTIDQADHIYVADQRNHRVIVYSSNGQLVKRIGASRSRGGTLRYPMGVAAVGKAEKDTKKKRASKSSKGKARLTYLRGDRSNEGKGHGFRKRNKLLGDIIHSSAIHVGAPRAHRGTGHACTASGVSQYPAFLAKHKKRTGVVYVGANDGALHGFRADNGQEVLAYLPGNLFSRESRKGYHYLTEPGYKHRYYVDGTPYVADAFIKGTASDRQWETVLLGSEGAGGRGLFALNVTNPDAFSEANASKIVMWEFTNKDDSHLGYTFAQPTIALMPNCRWAAIVGNGYADTALDKTAGQSQLFIIYLDGGTDGVWTLGKDYIRIPTGVGSHSNRNGLSTPSVVDLNRDGVADRVYAGDLHGNLWVFDFTSPNPTDWIRNKKLLFAAGKKQPITVKPTLIRHPVLRTPTGPDLMVFFATGQYFAKDDHRTTTKQSFYAVTDRGRGNLARRHLLRQRFLKHSLGSERRITDSSLTVDYGKHYGWYLDLPATGERVVSKAFAVNGLIHFNTLKPSGKGSCPKSSSGWMMSLKTENGGNPIEHGFRRIGDSLISSVGRVSAHRTTTDAEPIHHSGKKFDSAKGIPSGPVVVDGRRYTAGTKTKKADELVISNDPNRPKNLSGRLSWMQLFPRQS